MDFKLTLLLYVLLLLVEAPSFAQTITVNGIVLNETTKEPLNFAAIYSVKTNNGVYTDEQGLFTLTVDQQDTIVVSFLSFEQKKIPVREIKTPVEIFLRETAYELNPVTVKSNRKRPKKYEIGFYSERTNFDGWGIGIGNIAVNFIKNQAGSLGRLQTLLVDLGKGRKQIRPAKARLRLFAVDPSKRGPGRDLLTENIVFNIPARATDLRINLNTYNLSFPPEGIFIGLEFLGFETKKGIQNTVHTKWHTQTGTNITSTLRQDYSNVGATWRYPDTQGQPRWINITDGSKHKNWEAILFKIGAIVESLD